MLDKNNIGGRVIIIIINLKEKKIQGIQSAIKMTFVANSLKKQTSKY